MAVKPNRSLVGALRFEADMLASQERIYTNYKLNATPTRSPDSLRGYDCFKVNNVGGGKKEKKKSLAYVNDGHQPFDYRVFWFIYLTQDRFAPTDPEGTRRIVDKA